MSQSPQRRNPTSQSPARTMNVRHDNRRSLGLMNTPQGFRGRLPLLAVLLALAALVLVPAVGPGRRASHSHKPDRHQRRRHHDAGLGRRRRRRRSHRLRIPVY